MFLQSGKSSVDPSVAAYHPNPHLNGNNHSRRESMSSTMKSGVEASLTQNNSQSFLKQHSQQNSHKTIAVGAGT